MKIVLDTNVLISGLLSPDRAPAHILQMILEGSLTLCHDPRILAEYREVIHRPKFGFPANAIDDLLQFIETDGLSVTAPPLPTTLPDADDLMFLEIAVAAKADYLITGNLKHFPHTSCHGISVINPASFVRIAQNKPSD